MKTSRAIIAAAMICGIAACGVDKDGTADNLVNELRDAGLTISDEAADCIKDVVKDYSDDDLRALSENTADADLQAEFGQELLDCGIG
jgi:hypothetical protein